MSKKNRQRALHSTDLAPTGVPLEVQPPAPQRPRDRAGFNPDYSYVVKDLKRIALLAGSLIGLLILLSLFLR
jgi:hypothetical protein